MSTMVAIPVRVKPPPAEIGRDHLAELRVLGDDDPRERRADRAVIHVLRARPRSARQRPGPVLAGRLDLGPQAVGGRCLSLARLGRRRSRDFSSSCWRLSPSRSALARLTSKFVMRAAVASRGRLGRPGSGAGRPRRRAGPGPGPPATSMPSSTRTSRTRAVILAAIVARRRGVT